MNDFQIISLDIEASNSDPSTGEILSLAMVDEHMTNTFYKEVFHEELFLSVEAMRINKLDLFGLRLDSLPEAEVEAQAIKWLRPFDNPKALGLNVGSFDLVYIKTHMPRLFNRFGYRVIDLNSLFGLMTTLSNSSFANYKADLLFKAANYVRETYKLEPHHALGDAYSNLYCLRAILAELSSNE